MSGHPGVPSVLRDPPWRRKAAAPCPPALPRAATPAPAAVLAWQDGEQAAFAPARAAPLGREAEERLFDRLLDAADARKPLPPAELARLSDEMLGQIAEAAAAPCFDTPSLKLLLGRLGDRVLRRVVAIVRTRLPESGVLAAAAPIRASELAAVAAERLAAQSASDAESDAERWLARHAEIAVCGLGNDPAGRGAAAYVAARTGHAAREDLLPLAGLAPAADRALALAAARGDERAVMAWVAERPASPAFVPWVAAALAGPARSGASRWLEEHAALARPVLESDGARWADALALLGGDASAGDPALADLPPHVPPLPAFFDPATLPAVTLTDGTPLSSDEVRALGDMLRFSSLTRPYAGLAVVKAACDASTLDRFASALFAAWLDAGEAPTDRWTIEAVAKIGGEASATRVAERTRAWAVGATPPRSGWDGDARAVVLLAEGDRAWLYARTGVDALGRLATPGALTVLDDLARRGSASWLRKEAQAALERASGGRSPVTVDARAIVSRARFEDAIVPDLGLDADGSLTLSLGPRAVRVGFDELLVPHAIDADGERLASFPRLRKTDDASAYALAKERWTSLQAACKSLARQQIGALEEAMCAIRTWRPAEHAARFVAHPLLRHLGRRLVWACVDEKGTVTASFRVAEDLSLADADDATFVLDPDARVAIAHPVALGDALSAQWTVRFADYQILQPFPQLARERPTTGATGHEVPHARGLATSRGRLFGLGRRGWAARADEGVLVRWERELLVGHAIVTIEVSPGIFPDGGESAEAQRIERAHASVPLERLPAIDRAELLREIDWLTR